MNDLDRCARHEEVAEARLRRLINERFGSDVPMGLDWLDMIDDIDVRIQQMQRHINQITFERNVHHATLREISREIATGEAAAAVKLYDKEK